ncbi:MULTISPECIES: hypothetical protein [unclassified Legionella]|uniref:hypothetical protein n=1 Tax=unclassified Legionella TaxID=2622702 RepID=UPI001E2D586E|nr:hypothetical protein [Legionella sp. 31fI33]MCC5013927.1 hypothetical protein [Legionella sp. 31fI33]
MTKKEGLILKIIMSLLWFGFLANSYALEKQISTKKISFQQISGLYNFFGKKISVLEQNINKDKLPEPYNFLLVQPLMTMGIEKYYHRTPKIEIISAKKDEQANTYSRAIVMLIDGNKKRDDVNIAQLRNEAVAVEFALITMNFSELPDKVITGVLDTKIPFGKLLVINQLKTYDTGQQYFAVQCDSVIEHYLHCPKNSRLYGRTNTIIRKDSQKWIAQVVEILSGPRCQDKSCQNLMIGIR